MGRLAIVSAILALVCINGCSPEQTTLSFESNNSSSLEHGERLTHVLGCVECHGQGLSGKDWSTPDFATMKSGNITRAYQKWGDEGLRTILTRGHRPAGRELWDMPSFLFTQLEESDLGALSTYISSIPVNGPVHPDPIFDQQAKKEMAAGIYISSRQEALEKRDLALPDAGRKHRLAQYIMRATCAECHGMDLRGGVPFPGAQPRPDLRIVAAYSRQDFETLLVTGTAAGGRELKMMSDTARARYSWLTPNERGAIFDYLNELARIDP